MALDVISKAEQLGLAGRLDENTKALFERMFESAELAKLKDSQLVSFVDIVFRFMAGFAFSRTPERKDQKLRYLKAKNYYKNRSEEHMEEILDGLFDTSTTVDSDVNGAPTSVNAPATRSQAEALFEVVGFTPDVVDQLSLMYQEEPERVFLKTPIETVGEDLQNQLTELYKKIGNDKFQRLNDLVIATDSPLVRVAWRADEHPNRNKSRIWIDIKTPDQYEVILDNNNDTVAEGIFFETRDYDSLLDRQNKFMQFQLWTAEFVIGFAIPLDKKLNEPTEVKPNDLRIIDVMLNPYKKLTFLPIRSKEPFEDYFVDDNSRLFVSKEEQLIIKALSNNNSAFSQGFAQPWFKTSNPSKFQSFKLGASRLILLLKGNPQESDDEFGYANNPANMNDILTNLSKSYSLSAQAFGVGSAEGDSTSSSSGVSLFISDDKKNKRINNDRPRYGKFEGHLFEIIKVVNNFHVANLQEGEKTDSKNIPEETTLSARFQKIVTPLSNTDQIEKEQFDLDERIADRVSIIMERNPDLTEEQAIAIIEKIDARTPEAAIVEESNFDN